MWWVGDRPQTWRDADWTSASLLPAPDPADAAIYVLAARTGGLKGAVADHSWIVVKRPGSRQYERWDKVGWGRPIRRDGWPADARWYSNSPRLVASLSGAAAREALPTLVDAIERYPFATSGDYRIFPGPNSNSFVAHVLRHVPQLDAVLPPTAVGRDFPIDGGMASYAAAQRDLHLSFGGYVGISVGYTSGVELNLFGLVAGIDVRRPAIKIPALGTFGF